MDIAQNKAKIVNWIMRVWFILHESNPEKARAMIIKFVDDLADEEEA